MYSLQSLMVQSAFATIILVHEAIWDKFNLPASGLICGAPWGTCWEMHNNPPKPQHMPSIS